MVDVRWWFGRCMDCTEEGHHDEAESVSWEQGALLDSSCCDFHRDKSLANNELCVVDSRLDYCTGMNNRDRRECLGDLDELLSLVHPYSAVSYRGLRRVRGRIQNESDISWRVTIHGSAVLETAHGGGARTCTLAPRSAIDVIIAYPCDEAGLGLGESEIFYKGVPFEGDGRIELARLDHSTSASTTFAMRFGVLDSEVIFFRELAYHEPEPCVRLADLGRFRTYLRQNGIELGQTTEQADNVRLCNPMKRHADVSLENKPVLVPVCISLLS